MRLGEVVREAWASAVAQRTPSVVIALVAAAMCLTTVLTVGRTAATQARVEDTLDEAGSRMLTISANTDDDLITPAVTDGATSLNVVDVALARTSAFDTTTHAGGRGGRPVSTWTVYGNLRDAVVLDAGRWPEPGEAIVAAGVAGALSLDGGVGALDSASGEQYSIVGTYRTQRGFTDFEAGALTQGALNTRLDVLIIVADRASTAAAAERQVLSLIGAGDPAALTVASPMNLAAVQQDITSQLRTFGAGLLLLVLGAGAILTTLIVLADVLAHRKDIGRRRALGASQGTVVALVIARTALPGTIGALIGVGVGIALAARSGSIPPVAFIGGTLVLAIHSGLLGATVPALIAASRDPVAVLRTA